MSIFKDIETIKTDVLVVGGGGAGFRAAIGAREKGVRTLLVSKGPLARSGASPMAGADLTCHGRGMRRAGFFGEPRDSEEKFMNDIVHHGSFLNDQKLTELYVKTGPDRMVEMVEWGIRPTFTDERAVFTVGTGIMDALHRKARQIGVEFLEDVTILDLIVTDGKVCGALGLDIKQGKFLKFDCKAVIQAGGGWHKAYTPITGSRELTGDSVAMSYRAGAELCDMEFVTFCCNVIYWPLYARGSIMVYVMSFLYGGVLENNLGERIFEKYDPWMVNYANHTEWNKCFISHVSAKEIREGKSSLHGGVYFRLGDEPFELFQSKAMASYPNWTFKGNDMSFIGKQLKDGHGVEVGPGAEYFEGGVAVNEKYETNLPGLFACGECASSVFGANRVAAATMEMLTTGAIAGKTAGEYATENSHINSQESHYIQLIERIASPLFKKEGILPSELRKSIQKTAMEKLGPIRNEGEILEFLTFLEGIKKEALPNMTAASSSPTYNKAWLEAIDVQNMVAVLELSARAALERKESRGVHYREDYPVVDNDNWLKEIVITKTNNIPTLALRPVNITLMSPPKGVTPYMDFTKKMMQAHSDTGGHH